MAILLEEADGEAQEVAIEDAASDEHGAEMDKDASDHGVGGSEHLECAYHVYALQHDDKESADYGEGTDEYHEYKYHDNVDVEDGEPSKGVGCQFLDAEYSAYNAVRLGLTMEKLKAIGGALYVVDIAD